MKNLAKILVIVAACLVLADVAGAAPAAPVPVLPFVRVSLPSTPIQLGTVWGPGLQKLAGQAKAHVVANCPYRLEASFRTFRHLQNSRVSMSPKHVTVMINGSEVPVEGGRVAIAQSTRPTPAGGVDVPVYLNLGVSGLASYPAGPYAGSLVIRVMAAP